MIELYLKLQQILTTSARFAEESLKPVKHYNLYRGQYEAPERFELFKCPAVFVDFSISWEGNQASNMGECTVNLHVVTEALADPSSDNTINQLAGLEILKYHAIIKELTEGVESTETGKLACTREAPNLTGVLPAYIMSFSSSIAKEDMDAGNYLDGDIEDVQIQKTYVLPE